MLIKAASERLRLGDPAAALALVDQAPDTSNAKLHAIRGAALLGTNRPLDALGSLRVAVALGEAEPVTLLNLALAEEKAGDPDRALRLMLDLEANHPSWDEPPLRIAEYLRRTRDAAAAEAAYRRVLSVNPSREEALLALAGLLLARGEAVDARELLVRCCGVAPKRADAWRTLGLALMATSEPRLAHSAFMQALALEPEAADHALLGMEAAAAAGEAEAELARLEVGLDADPLNVVLLAAQGILLERLGRRDAAIDSLEAAAVLAPESALVARLLGGLLARSNRVSDAATALTRARELDPDNPEIANDLAAVLMRAHRHAEARTLLVSVLEKHGDHLAVLCNLANATVCLGEQDEAVQLARRAIAFDPNSVLARRALCNVLAYVQGVAGTELLQSLQGCAVRLPRAVLPPFANSRDPNRPITIGLLSGTLRTHPVGWLTAAGVESLDRTQFSLVCLSQNSKASDPFARRYRAVAREWCEIDQLDDVALALRARELGIDVLIDLGGYGDASRMPACAHRLAPVQVKWVGMQYHSSGLPEMDWFITDRWETPPALEHLYSERLLRLPDGYVCYSPPAYAPDTVPLPALANGFITFGCFNNLAKLTPSVLKTWAEILHRVPTSRLVLKTHQFSDVPTADRIHAVFGGHGIDPERIELRGSSPHRAFMAEYNAIDIVLDPFPYSGGLTTCEALWMGVPVITLPGETFASRHSLSHLSNVGLADWAASDLRGYVELAVAKAQDVEGLAALRSGLRTQVKASPLCNAPRFGRSLGEALRHAWQRWCADVLRRVVWMFRFQTWISAAR
ncbi:MAG: tetratricopeptide repeat protein [Acetobacteraceae bacterium]|nr:tetratricopeptide repeat protein [Acetobacteraceae bacterium]